MKPVSNQHESVQAQSYRQEQSDRVPRNAEQKVLGQRKTGEECEKAANDDQKKSRVKFNKE